MQTFYTPTMEEKRRAKEKEERPATAKPIKRGGAVAPSPAEGKTLQKPGELKATPSPTKKSSTNVASKGKKK